MKRREFVTMIISFCAAGFMSKRKKTASESTMFCQNKNIRPEFFISKILFFRDVAGPENILGEPDGQYAEVLPGGQMIILMEDEIYPSVDSDDGMVVCKNDADYGLAGWVSVGTPEEPQKFAWMSMVSGVSPSGFRFSVRNADYGNPGVDMLKIINNDSKSLFIDGIVGYGRNPEESCW